MPSVRLIATLAVPLAGAALLVGLWRAWDAPGPGLAVASAASVASPASSPTSATPSDGPGATSAPGATAGAGATAGVTASGATISGAASGALDPSDPVLAAATVMRRFCDLVDRGYWRRARHLLAGPWVWPAGDLRTVVRMGFRSAKRHRTQLVDDFTFFARCSMRRHTPGTLYRDVSTLVFTLGRGGTDGGWLITAVTTRP